jgi:hypothetical protein
VGLVEVEGYLSRELHFINHYLFSSGRLAALLAGFRTDLSILAPGRRLSTWTFYDAVTLGEGLAFL